MRKRFILEENKDQKISQYSIIDTNNGSHSRVLYIADYIQDKVAFGNLLCILLNKNSKYKLPNELV